MTNQTNQAKPGSMYDIAFDTGVIMERDRIVKAIQVMRDQWLKQSEQGGSTYFRHKAQVCDAIIEAIATYTCDTCGERATVYAMGPYAGDMGGRYCQAHIPTGFMITDRYEAPNV